MYQSASPYAQPATIPYGAPQLSYGVPPPVSGSPQPGDMSYGQIMGQDGRIVYQLFRAVPASYPNPNGSGMMSGVQWTPTEIVSSPPAGAIPANPEFVASWLRANPAVASQAFSSIKEGNKESSRHSRHASDYEALQKARERDARSSYNASQAPGNAVPFPGTNTGYPVPGQATAYGGYPVFGDPNVAAGYVPYGIPTGGYPDLAQQMASMDLNRSKESTKERERKSSEKRSRKQSTHEAAHPQVAADPYALPPSGYPAVGPYGPTVVSAYGNPYAPFPMAPSSHSSNPSPNPPPRDLSAYGANPPPGAYGVAYPSSSSSRKRANSAVNPPAEGGRSKSRAPSPNPQPVTLNSMGYPQPQVRPASRIGGPSPHPSNANLPNHQLAAPGAFSRPINAALPYAPFKPVKAQDMDDFFVHMAKLPPVLESHDVRNEDWFRFMEDLTLAWTGRLPAANRQDGKHPKPAILAAELIYTWNTAYFEPRGVEIVLYRGSQRRSGKLYGRNDLNPEEDETSSSSSTESESGDDYPPPSTNAYNRAAGPDDLAAARRRCYEEKQAIIKRRRERRKRNKERRRNKRYTLYATWIRDGGPARSNVATPAGLPPMAMMPVSSYPGMYGIPGSMGPPPGKPKSHSRGPSVGGTY